VARHRHCRALTHTPTTASKCRGAFRGVATAGSDLDDHSALWKSRTWLKRPWAHCSSYVFDMMATVCDTQAHLDCTFSRPDASNSFAHSRVVGAASGTAAAAPWSS
jgi:hypothetical protein